MQETKNKRVVTGVGLLFALYIISWQCYTGKDIRLLLYGGYAIVCSLTFIKLMFSGYGTTIQLPKPAERLFLFSIFCASSTLWAINSSGAINESIFIFACVIMVILLSNYFIRLGNVDILFMTIILMGIAMATVVIIREGGLGAFYERATISAEIQARYGIRVGGDVFNANALGMCCGYSSVLLLFFAIFYKKWYCYVLMIIPLVALIASASKKAIILLVIGFMMVVYYSLKQRRDFQKYAKIFFGGIVLVFILRFVLSMDIMYTVTRRMETFLNMFNSDNTASVDNSSSIRFSLITEGIKQFFKTPFFGLGMSGSVNLNRSKLNFPAYSHCDYVEHLVNGGLIGFLLYYSVFIMLIKDYVILMKKDDDPKLILSFIFMILFLAMNFACVTYYIEMTTYLYFILWISQIEIKKRELAEKEKTDNMVIDNE